MAKRKKVMFFRYIWNTYAKLKNLKKNINFSSNRGCYTHFIPKQKRKLHISQDDYNSHEAH